MQYHSLKKRARYYYLSHLENKIHTFKYLVAFLLGYMTIQFLPYGKSQWVLITIAVIMSSQTILGLQINKAIMRILGTLVGALLGMATLFLPHNHFIMVPCIIVAALFFSYIAPQESNRSYIATLGMATFAMIAFASPPTIYIAFLRTLDILIGITISLLVSRFIFPLNSPRALLLNVDKCSNNMSQLVQMIFIDQRERRKDEELLQLNIGIRKDFERLHLILSGLKYETIKQHNIKQKSANNILKYLHAIYQYLLFIDTALWDLRGQQSSGEPLLKKIVQPFMLNIIKLLQQLAMQKPLTINLNDDYDAFAKELTLLKLAALEHQSADVIIFCMKRITICIQPLFQGINLIANTNKPPTVTK